MGKNVNIKKANYDLCVSTYKCRIFDVEGNFCTADLIPRTPNCNISVSQSDEEKAILKTIEDNKNIG